MAIETQQNGIRISVSENVSFDNGPVVTQQGAAVRVNFTGHDYHDDMQGLVDTALVGVTTYTRRELRSTGIVLPHVAQSDVFSHILQLSHRKTLGVALDNVHMHFIPVAAANGDIQINYSWGWYNPMNDTIPATLPNTGSVVIPLVAADQFKTKVVELIPSLTPPEGEQYSSMVLCKFERVAPAGTNWGSGNEIAILYLDAHMPVSRTGSYNELTD